MCIYLYIYKRDSFGLMTYKQNETYSHKMPQKLKSLPLQPVSSKRNLQVHGIYLYIYRVYQKKFTVGKGLLIQKACNADNKIL